MGSPTYIHTFPESVAVSAADFDAFKRSHPKPELCPDCKPLSNYVAHPACPDCNCDPHADDDPTAVTDY